MKRNDFELKELEEKYLGEVKKTYNVTITLLSKISVPTTSFYTKVYLVKYETWEDRVEETIQYGEEDVFEKTIELLEKIKEAAMLIRLASELNEILDEFETVEKLDHGYFIKFPPYKATSVYSEGLSNVVEVCSVPAFSIMIIPFLSTDTFFLHVFADQDYLKDENYHSLQDIVEKVKLIKNIRDMERKCMINS